MLTVGHSWEQGQVSELNGHSVAKAFEIGSCALTTYRRLTMTGAEQIEQTLSKYGGRALAEGKSNSYVGFPSNPTDGGRCHIAQSEAWLGLWVSRETGVSTGIFQFPPTHFDLVGRSKCVDAGKREFSAVEF